MTAIKKNTIVTVVDPTNSRVGQSFIVNKAVTISVGLRRDSEKLPGFEVRPLGATIDDRTTVARFRAVYLAALADLGAEARESLEAMRIAKAAEVEAARAAFKQSLADQQAAAQQEQERQAAAWLVAVTPKVERMYVSKNIDGEWAASGEIVLYGPTMVGRDGVKYRERHRVDFARDIDYNTKQERRTINWSAIGSTGVDEARAYVRLLSWAANFIECLDEQHANLIAATLLAEYEQATVNA